MDILIKVAWLLLTLVAIMIAAAIGICLLFITDTLAPTGSLLHFLLMFLAAVVGFTLIHIPYHLYRKKLPKKWQCLLN